MPTNQNPEPKKSETETETTSAETLAEVQAHLSQAVLGLQKISGSPDTADYMAMSCSSCAGGSC